ncbi:MAG: alpha-L-fucosidase [Verrucomicrobiota bacterium]
MKPLLQKQPLLSFLLASLLLTQPLLSQNAALVAKGPEHEERMQWWRDARFGLFIHWGLYAIPAGVWKGETARKDYAEWTMHNFQVPQAEYSQLAKDFNPTEFDADVWARLAKEAGMKYFVLTTKHHDGFAMYDSEISDYNVVDATPFKRDVFGELVEAFTKQGLRVGAYYSQDLDWSVDQGGAISSYNTWDFDNPEPNYEKFDQYLKEKALPQIEEISTKYGDISTYWFDFPRMVNKDRGKLVHDTVRATQPDAVINGRICTPQGNWADYLVPGDNGFFTSPQPADWECCATMDESWGYKVHAHAKRTADDLIFQLATTVAAGGNLLLNIGPKPDGTIPQRQIDILEKIGVWMKDNSEAIHGCRANPFKEFFSWGPCTVKGNQAFMHIADWEAGKVVELPRLQNKVEKVELLGDLDRKLEWKQDGTDLKITLSGESTCTSLSVIKVTCAGDTLEIDPPAIAEEDGILVLETRYGESLGQKMRNLRHSLVEGKVVTLASEGHSSEKMVWEISIDEPGTFEVTANFLEADRKGVRPRSLLVNTGGKANLTKEVTDKSIDGATQVLGEVNFSKAGSAQVTLQARGGKGGTDLYLEGLKLTRK